MSEQRLLAGPQYLTVEQIAERLQVSVETVRGWLRRGLLAGSRIGGRGMWRVTESQLAAMMTPGLDGRAQ